jgi:dolichyl-phosphate beta-glucosyltransferase
MYLSVIIPAYNESERIEKTLRSVHAHLSRKDYEYEIIVVNDGSKDTTATVVELSKLRVPHLRLINNTENHGKGWVVRQGMLEAKGRYRLFMDADGSTSIDHLDKLFPYLEQGYDIVIGSRRAAGSNLQKSQGFIRDALGHLFRFIVNTMVPVGVIDSQNGFKMFTARAAEDIFRRQRIFTWSFDVEVLAIARMLGYTVKEVGVHWVNDDRSTVTFKGMVKALIEILQIRINLWSRVYSKTAEEYSAV